MPKRVGLERPDEFCLVIDERHVEELPDVDRKILGAHDGEVTEQRVVTVEPGGVDDDSDEARTRMVLLERARQHAREWQLSARDDGAGVHGESRRTSMPADPIFEGRPGRAPDPLPWWYRGGLVALLAVVAAIGAAGTALAMLGWFTAPALVVAAAPIAYVLIGAWRPTLAHADHPRGVRPAAAAVLIVVCFVGLQMREATEHVIVDRDPGVYLTTGLSVARTGSLLVDPQSSAFGTPPPAHVRFDSPGYYTGAPDGQLYPQFLHVLPVLIAVGEGIGGPAGAVKVPALLEGIALLAIYAFATRFLRPTLALAVVVLVALNLTTIVFSRDAYTEPLTQLLLFGALWTIWPARQRLSPGLGTAAGFLLGVCVMTRIDAVVYLIPIVAWGFFELHRDW